jgi:hypothetical protein
LRNLWILVGIFAATAAVSSAAESINALLDVDTYVDSGNATDSFSGEKVLWATSMDGTPSKEVYLGFIKNFHVSPDNISSVTLRLYASKVEKPGRILAYISEGQPLETTTWNYKLAYNTTISVPFNVEGEGECDVDVTDMIRNALKACECPYSIVLVADDSASVAFASQESSEEMAPSLKIDAV